MYILEDNILPIPKKVKAIRKYLKLKQEDITEEKISRSLISYIENGKVKLTRDVAQIIANSFKKVMAEKDMPFEVDDVYLMADEMEQGNRLLSKYFVLLKANTDYDDNEFIQHKKMIETILASYPIYEKKAEIYEFLGDLYYDGYEYDRGYEAYMLALESYTQLEKTLKIVEIITKLARCCISIGENWIGIKLNDYALVILKREGYEHEYETLYKRCLFNNAKAYKQLNRYDEAVDYLNELEIRPYIEDNEVIDALTLKGNCYILKEDYKKAEEVYDELLSLVSKRKDFEAIGRAYTNMSVLYYKRGDVDKAIRLDEEALELRQQIESKEICKTLLKLGGRHRVLNKYDIGEKYLLRGVKEAEKQDDIDTKVNLYIELLKLYKDNHEVYLADGLIEEMKDMFEKKYDVANLSIRRGMENFILEAVQHLVDLDSFKSKELINLLLERRRDV